MYKIPKELDLSPIVGESTTQICVGQFDLQFAIGKAHFAIESTVLIIKDGREIGRWEQGEWPGAAFYELMNIDVKSYEIPNDRQIIVRLENGLEMILEDSSDQYESMQISIDGDPCLYVI